MLFSNWFLKVAQPPPPFRSQKIQIFYCIIIVLKVLVRDLKCPSGNTKINILFAYLNAAEQPVQLLTYCLHQLIHNPHHKLCAHPRDLRVDTGRTVHHLLHVVARSAAWAHTFGPIKLAHVHVVLNNSNNRLTFQFNIRVEQLLVQHLVHADGLAAGLLQRQLLDIIQIFDNSWNHEISGKLAVVEAQQQAFRVLGDVGLITVVILRCSVLHNVVSQI